MADYTFRAELDLSLEDFDQTFDLLDKHGQRIGMCGVGLGAQIEHAVVALDVWLAEEEAETVIFLLSDYAIDDEGVYNTLSNHGEVLRLSEGLTVNLKTPAFRAEAYFEALTTGAEVVEVFARPTLLSRLFNRQSEPALLLQPEDYFTTARVTLKVWQR